MGELLFEIFMTALAYSTGIAETIAGTLMDLTRKGEIKMKSFKTAVLGLFVNIVTTAVVVLYISKTHDINVTVERREAK